MVSVSAALWFRAIELLFAALVISYLSLKFWLLRRHFIIASSRFPKFTLLITMALFLMTLMMAVPEYIALSMDSNQNIQSHVLFQVNISFTMALFFTFFILIILRTYLVYKKGVRSQHMLQIKTAILLNALNEEHDDLSQEYDVQSTTFQKVVISISISIAIISQLICAIFDVILNGDCPECSTSRIISFAVLFIIGVITLIVTRNTKESVNCRKETLVTVIVIVAELLATFGGRKVGIPFEWRRCIGTALAIINFVTLLVVPLRLIYKVEGTISHKKIKFRQTSEDYSNQDLIEHIKSEKHFHLFADFLVCR